MPRAHRLAAAAPVPITVPKPAPAAPTVTLDRSTVFAVLAVLAIWWWASSSTPAPRPWAPQKERPVITWVIRTAKSLLWLAAFAERPPAAPEQAAVQQRIGDDGFPLVDHSRGW